MEPDLTPLGECALLMRWGNAMDGALNARIAAFARQLEAVPFAGFREVAPAYCSLAIHYDPARVEGTAPTRFDALARTLRDRWQKAPRDTPINGRAIEIEVRYGGGDLAALSKSKGLSEDQIVELHSGREYRVYMMGFLPGFAYLGEVDERIAAPRHMTPRLRVETGSVGIAGRQTGVYPMTSPGGWQIIGRTDVVLFDAAAAEPTLLAPGDTVRFRAI
jgi:inhibitor of KinA